MFHQSLAKGLNVVRKIKSYIDKALEALLILMFVSMFIVVLIQVFTRFIMNNPASWTEEVARYLMVWMSFLGAGVGLKYGLHMSLGIVTDRLSGMASTIVRILCVLLTLLVGVIIAYFGFRYMMVGKERVSMALQFPMIYAFAVMPFGGAVILMNSMEALFNIIGEEASTFRKRKNSTKIYTMKEQ